MKKEELSLLFMNKEKEGKSYKQIKKEIENLIKYQKGMKLDRRLIAKQQFEIQNLKIKIEKLQSKLFNKRLESGLNLKEKTNKCSSKNSKQINLLELKRLLNIIKCSNGILKKELLSSTKITECKINTGLSFLIRNNLVQESINKKGVKEYK